MNLAKLKNYQFAKINKFQQKKLFFLNHDFIYKLTELESSSSVSKAYPNSDHR